jgi:hypothetical protein
MEPPFNVAQFKVFPLLVFNFNGPRTINSVLNYFHLRFSSVQCSNPLIPKDTLNRDFTVD